MDYIYKTTLYHNTTDVLGVSPTNTADTNDYVTNFRSLTVKASSIVLAEQSLIFEKTYTEFKALIVVPLLWDDVKEVTKTKSYELYFFSPIPL